MGFKSFEDHGLRHKVGDDGHVVTLASSLPFSVSLVPGCHWCPETSGRGGRVLYVVLYVPPQVIRFGTPWLGSQTVLPDATIVLGGCSNHWGRWGSASGSTSSCTLKGQALSTNWWQTMCIHQFYENDKQLINSCSKVDKVDKRLIKLIKSWYTVETQSWWKVDKKLINKLIKSWWTVDKKWHMCW